MQFLWRPRTALVLVLLFALQVTLCPAEAPSDPAAPKPGHVPKPNSSLTARKVDVDRQGSLLAGPMFLGLATLLFPVLPILLLAPMAVAGVGPVMNYFSDTFGSGSGSQGAATPAATNTGSQLGDLLSSLGSLAGGQEPTPSESSLSSVVQALGLGSGSSASDSSSSLGSGLLSGLFSGSSGSSSSSSSAGSSLLSSLLNSEAASSLLGTSGSSILGSLASGSKPVPSIALPPGKLTQPGKHSSSTADFIGAAAAALDNAGLLASLTGGSGSSAASASLASQLLNAAGGMGGIGAGLGGGAAGVKPLQTASSNALSEILNGITANLGSPNPQAGPHMPQLGNSLSSNIIQGLPVTASQIQQGLASASKPSSSLASLLGLGGSSAPSAQSGSFHKLANTAINSISNFLFSKRRSEWVPPHYPEFLLDSAASKAKGGIFAYLKDTFSMVKDGVRRYEISESECQARLMCEFHQQATGRSFKTWANTILDMMGVESYLERSQFGARTKSAMKDLYRAARNGMTEKDCAELYSKCPVSIAVEPLRNSVLNKFIGRPAPANALHPQAHPQAAHQALHRPSIVYGPSKLNLPLPMAVAAAAVNNNNNQPAVGVPQPAASAPVPVVLAPAPVPAPAHGPVPALQHLPISHYAPQGQQQAQGHQVPGHVGSSTLKPTAVQYQPPTNVNRL